MFNLGFIWSLFGGVSSQVFDKLANSIKAGPVDDAARSGLDIKKIGSTALVEMRGPMLKEAGWLSAWGFAGTVETEQALLAAANDNEIESILWVIDSAGGSVDGLDSLYKTAKSIGKEKEITVQVDGMLASAALYVASAANKIYANRRDLIGSIGARMMIYDYSAAFENAGIKAIPIDTGEFKSAGAMGTEITKEQQADFQRVVDGYFADFVLAVTEGRPISKKDFDSLADGRIFFADEQPIETGLIDGIRSTRQAFSDVLAKNDTLQAANRTRLMASADARLRLLSL